ncbi:Calcineurin-like_phosphoesterase domain-containing protein [Hexamita inflata]|uniref:Calcineurin-like phosphoesterase domain-containing protein n=1 Tax=Hexamita inflata TaxID=28002 RepID=A0AA86NFD2_9EUKA|nr:Calcineurin-like phosphoesterase domain-containing protein [Hexamita inflata]
MCYCTVKCACNIIFCESINTSLTYEKVIGVFVIYTLNGQDVDAFNFLKDNAHLALDSEHVFIISHQPTYTTGEHGLNKTLSVQMERFIDTHQNLNLRAVFSGHSHVFTAFKRNDLFISLMEQEGVRWTRCTRRRKWAKGCGSRRSSMEAWWKLMIKVMDINTILTATRNLRARKFSSRGTLSCTQLEIWKLIRLYKRTSRRFE